MAENSISDSSKANRGDTASSSKKNFNETFGAVSDQVMKGLRDLPDSSREIFSQVDRQVRANPWLNIGIVAAGGMALGFLAGKMMSSGRVSRIEMDDSFDE